MNRNSKILQLTLQEEMTRNQNLFIGPHGSTRINKGHRVQATNFQ